MPAPLQTAVLATSPRWYLTLDDPNGPAASDSSGNGHPGVYANVPQFGIDGVPGGGDSAIGFYPQLSAPWNRVILASGFCDFARLSFMVWTRIFAGGSTEVWASNSHNSSEGWYIQFNVADQLVHAGFGGTAGYVTVADPGGISRTLQQWRCYVITRDAFSQTIQLYVDGVLRGAGTGVQPFSIDGGAGLLGALNNENGNQQPYTADMAHAAIWDRVLTPAEIQSIWTAGGARPATGGAVAVDLAPLAAQLTTIINRQAHPFQYTLGIAHNGLSGDGQFGVLAPIGLLVQTSSVSPLTRVGTHVPFELFNGGYITWGDANGFKKSARIEHNPQFYFPLDMEVVSVWFNVPAGGVINIVELQRAN